MRRLLKALILVMCVSACSELASVDRSKIPTLSNMPGTAGTASDEPDDSKDDEPAAAGSAADGDNDAGAPETDGGA